MRMGGYGGRHGGFQGGDNDPNMVSPADRIRMLLTQYGADDEGSLGRATTKYGQISNMPDSNAAMYASSLEYDNPQQQRRGGGNQPWWANGSWDTNQGGVQYKNWQGGGGMQHTNPLPDIMRPRAYSSSNFGFMRR